MSRFIANIGEKCYILTYWQPGVYRNAFILPHGAPVPCVLARSFAFLLWRCARAAAPVYCSGPGLGLLGPGLVLVLGLDDPLPCPCVCYFFFTKKTRFLSDNIYESKNNNMYNTTRTDLLNYLNNNSIEYTFDKQSQTIQVNLTVTKE